MNLSDIPRGTGGLAHTMGGTGIKSSRPKKAKKRGPGRPRKDTMPPRRDPPQFYAREPEQPRARRPSTTPSMQLGLLRGSPGGAKKTEGVGLIRGAMGKGKDKSDDGKPKKMGYFARRKAEKEAKKEAKRKDQELKDMEKQEAKRIQSGERLRVNGTVKEASITEVPGTGYAVSLSLVVPSENDASALLAEIIRQVRG